MNDPFLVRRGGLCYNLHRPSLLWVGSGSYVSGCGRRDTLTAWNAQGKAVTCITEVSETGFPVAVLYSVPAYWTELEKEKKLIIISSVLPLG